MSRKWIINGIALLSAAGGAWLGLLLISALVQPEEIKRPSMAIQTVPRTIEEAEITSNQAQKQPVKQSENSEQVQLPSLELLSMPALPVIEATASNNTSISNTWQPLTPTYASLMSAVGNLQPTLEAIKIDPAITANDHPAVVHFPANRAQYYPHTRALRRGINGNISGRNSLRRRWHHHPGPFSAALPKEFLSGLQKK